MRGNPVRKQVLVIAAAAIVVAAGAVAWYLLTQRHVGLSLAQGERTNLLWIDRGAAGGDGMTVISLSEEELVLLSLPAAVRVKGPEGDVVAASDVYASVGGAGAAQAISDLLGIEIPFHLAVDGTLWVEWIDAIGGVMVALDAAAIYTDTSVDPPVRVEIRAGERTLSGTEAIAFARSEGLPGDVGRPARRELLLEAALEQAIREQTSRTLRDAVRGRFAIIETNCTLEDLYDVAAIFHDVPAEDVRLMTLPTETALSNGQVVVEPKIVEAERIVASALKGLDLLTPDEVNIAVFNGNGVREMASRTAEYLRARGFSITRIGNADSFDYSPSYVVVLTDEAKAWILQDALPPNEIRIVFPETFEASYAALRDYVPVGTDLLLIAGQGMVIE